MTHTRYLASWKLRSGGSWMPCACPPMNATEAAENSRAELSAVKLTPLIHDPATGEYTLGKPVYKITAPAPVAVRLDAGEEEEE